MKLQGGNHATINGQLAVEKYKQNEKCILDLQTRNEHQFYTIRMPHHVSLIRHDSKCGLLF